MWNLCVIEERPAAVKGLPGAQILSHTTLALLNFRSGRQPMRLDGLAA